MRNPADELPEFTTGEEFDALSDADKAKVALYFERRALRASERAEVRELKNGSPEDRQGRQGHLTQRGERPSEAGRCVRKAQWNEARRTFHEGVVAGFAEGVVKRNAYTDSSPVPAQTSAHLRALPTVDEFHVEEAYALMDQVAIQEGWNDPALDVYSQLDPRKKP